jgi:uncharacterized protein YbbC (DUF1343 family)
MHTRRRLLFDLAAASSCGMVGGAAFAEGNFATGPYLEAVTPLDERRLPAGAALNAGVLTGVDVLAAEGFAQLSGLRVGLITNQTGRDALGRRTIDLLWSAHGVRLTAIFSPEHGLSGDREGKIDSAIDASTGLPVRSLYGAMRRPTAEMLSDVDALVVDLQDVGVRFFTFVTTMAYAMEAAATRGLRVVVLDRPNPIGAAGVRGPVMDPSLRSFTGYFAMPVQHGMTIGELATMFEAENRIDASLAVVPMRGYRRDLWFDETGLEWVNPSPNLRSLDEAILYPGVGLIEGTNVSVGRGTPTPFETVGAPWIDGQVLTNALNGRDIGGVRFDPADFTPAADRYAQEPCHGVRVTLANRAALDAPRLGVELATALRGVHPQKFDIAGMLGNLGSRESLAALAAGADVSTIIASWRPALETFEAVRAKHLLYR